MPHTPLRIVADENITFVREAFNSLGTVQRLPGRAITPDAVREADVLLTRSVTQVDAALIEAGAALQFVGSATIGTDHIDLAALRARGITFAHAPGSNAEAVVEYVVAALFRLSVTYGEPLRGKTVGVVGCGNIGGRMVARLAPFGLRVIKNDPPLAARAEEAGALHDFVSLDAVLADADIVTVHVPLTREGPHATRYLFDKSTLKRLKPGAWLINAARGAVVENSALKQVLEASGLGAVVLDVWEQEPTPDIDLLRRVDLATPHIAGHSFDGKVQGTCMLYDALVQHQGVAPTWDRAAALAPGPSDRLLLQAPDAALPEAAWLDALTRQMYDLPADDARLRRVLEQPPEDRGAFFIALRKFYPRRRAFPLHTLDRHAVPAAYRTAVADGLRVTLVD